MTDTFQSPKTSIYNTKIDYIKEQLKDDGWDLDRHEQTFLNGDEVRFIDAYQTKKFNGLERPCFLTINWEKVGENYSVEYWIQTCDDTFSADVRIYDFTSRENGNMKLLREVNNQLNSNYQAYLWQKRKLIEDLNENYIRK
tara:strand:- start:34 stop:456 length:423 start_codon:yes stop_codon:yes gene_type:complete